MKNIAVVYWSGTGNTQTMAEAVVDGIKEKGANAELIEASDFSQDSVAKYDAIAFGCPAMGAEELEDSEFEPMFSDVESSLSGKTIALFGSYDWGDGEWMRTWEERCTGQGANVVKTVIANNEPDDDAISECKELGAALC